MSVLQKSQYGTVWRHLNFLGVMKPTNSREIADATEAAAAARKTLDEGTDGIKMYTSSSTASISVDAIQAAVNEAHRVGKPVFVHSNNAADALASIRGGADVVVHTTPRSQWETILTAMKERRVALNPTLHVFKYHARHDRISAQDQIVNTTAGQLRAWVAAGGTVVSEPMLGPSMLSLPRSTP